MEVPYTENSITNFMNKNLFHKMCNVEIPESICECQKRLAVSFFGNEDPHDKLWST